MVATFARVSLIAVMVAGCQGRKESASTRPAMRIVSIAETGGIRAIVELESGAVLVGGDMEGGDGIHGAIFRLDRKGRARRVFFAKQKVVSIVVAGGLLWAGVSDGYQDQWLTWSVDEGRSWVDSVPVPIDGLWAVQVTDGSVWAYDLAKLVRSDDRGTSWHVVQTARKVSLDSRFRGHGQNFCQYGDGYWCTVDGGSTWKMPYGKAVIVAIDHSHRFAVERRGKSFRVVALEKSLVPVGVEFDAHEVRDVRVERSSVAVLAGPAPTSLKNVMRGWIYISSLDAGRTWQRRRLVARTSSIFDEHPAYMARTREIVAIPGGVRLGLVERASPTAKP